jgi:hypothetical protein
LTSTTVSARQSSYTMPWWFDGGFFLRDRQECARARKKISSCPINEPIKI